MTPLQELFLRLRPERSTSCLGGPDQAPQGGTMTCRSIDMIVESSGGPSTECYDATGALLRLLTVVPRAGDGGDETGSIPPHDCLPMGERILAHRVGATSGKEVPVGQRNTPNCPWPLAARGRVWHRRARIPALSLVRDPVRSIEGLIQEAGRHRRCLKTFLFTVSTVTSVTFLLYRRMSLNPGPSDRNLSDLSIPVL